MELVIFNYAKIDCAIFTNKRHPSDVEHSYIPIFRFIQSAVYPVGVSKDCACFMQIIKL